MRFRLAWLLSCLCLLCGAQDVPDSTAPPTPAHDTAGSPVVDDPEGEYEKKKAPPPMPCDDGIGPDPNLLGAALEGSESVRSAAGVAPLLDRVVAHTVSKFSNIDMETGRPFEKPKAKRIPMCPGARPRRPVPGVDCELPEPEEKTGCCDCGCGCCSMLRRVVKRTTNKFRNINMETGKAFKSLPSCVDFELSPRPLPKKRVDLPLKKLLSEKVHASKNT